MAVRWTPGHSCRSEGIGDDLELIKINGKLKPALRQYCWVLFFSLKSTH